MLNRKLAHGITFVDLKDSKGQTLPMIPTMLSSLKNLRSLRIDFGPTRNFADSLTDSVQNLKSLQSSKLESLALMSFDAGKLFSTCFARSTHNSDQDTSNFDSLLDLSVQFPSLRSLLIFDYLDVSTISELPRLPPNLTSIRAPGLSITLDSGPLFAEMPRFLESWEGPFLVSPMENGKAIFDIHHIRSKLQHIFSNPPPRLTYINSMRNLQMPASLGFAHLPKTLNISGLFDFNYLSMGVLPTIPPATKKISITGFSDAWWANEPSTAEWMALLPTHLEDFALRLPSFSLSFDHIRCLPRTLKTFTWGMRSNDSSPNWKDKADPSIWPPTLTRLLLMGETVPNEVKKCLPATLMHLECGHDEKEIVVLPSLNTLSLQVNHPKIEFFPQSLLTDDLMMDLPGDLSSKLLPGDNLRDLVLEFSDNIPFTEEMPFDLNNDFLPRNLVQLQISRFPMNWFDKLPRTLTSFNCGGLTGLPDIDVNSEPRDYFSALPTRLTSLMLNKSYLSEDPKKPIFPAISFSSLPYLQVLVFDLGWVDPQVVDHLQFARIVQLELTHPTDATDAFESAHSAYFNFPEQE